MTEQTYRAMLITKSVDPETEKKTFDRTITQRAMTELEENDVLIKVAYSSLNFKDGLSATGMPGVTREFPHTPGVDASGTVVESTSGAYAAGDEVIVTGYDLGMETNGGFGEYIRVPAEWVVPLPAGLTLRQAMIYGTAGVTAALSLYEFEMQGMEPSADNEILVTGASGGVGSMAVAMLAKLGYSVVAVSGKPEAKEMLTKLGAKEVITREEANDESGRPVLRGRWAGVVDTVGGDILTTALKATRYGGSVTCCGLVAGADFSSSVFPFILRGVRLLGIDSVEMPMDKRLKIWSRIATDWQLDNLETLTKEVSLEGVSDELDLILKGKQIGRVLVKI